MLMSDKTLREANCAEQQCETQAVDKPLRVRVEIEKGGLPRLRCLEGQETVKLVALNPAGFNALIEQDLMRRPHSLKVGALHNWVELDGEMFRFEEGTNGVAEFEKVLNERYVSEAKTRDDQNVAVFTNPASPTGFDLQFPASPHGFAENRRRHLNEETVEILQDPQKCRVLRKGMIARLTPPNLVFKLRQPDGSERYLEHGPETTLTAPGKDGQIEEIDLSQPLDLLHLSARELTAVLNHPAINRRAKLAEEASHAGRH